jgi:hypothetical protein
MSDQANGNLSDKDKIDRAAQHEELRFYKRGCHNCGGRSFGRVSYDRPQSAHHGAR